MAGGWIWVVVMWPADSVLKTLYLGSNQSDGDTVSLKSSQCFPGAVRRPLRCSPASSPSPLIHSGPLLCPGHTKTVFSEGSLCFVFPLLGMVVSNGG